MRIVQSSRQVSGALKTTCIAMLPASVFQLGDWNAHNRCIITIMTVLTMILYD